MVQVEGKMVVHQIQSGPYGPWNVATLYSSIGDFVVRYAGLDIYDEGTYHGLFLITSTYLKSRKFRVGTIIEPVAEIDEITLFDADTNGIEDLEVPDVDPVEEVTIQLPVEQAAIVDLSTKAASTSDAQADHSMELELFADLWPLTPSVVLDKTVDRLVLRRQIAYLLSHGYKNNPLEGVFELDVTS